MPDAERWRLVDSILGEALELPDDERRRALLAARCGTDQELRRRVERLLAADRAATGFLETPPFERIEQALAAAGNEGGEGAEPPPHPTPEPGAAVGRYVIEEKIGEGGMGAVYAAHDPELGRTVALKLVHPDRDTGPSRERLLREAQALARVSHPNVVTVYDVGRHGDAVFLAMECVPGGTLDDWLAAEERDWRQVVTAFLAAGQGLAAAHDAGIVHRDFKPSNVLVDDDGRWRVADFGLACTGAAGPREDGGGAEDEKQATDLLSARLTGAGWMLGTPSYMAPEQHLGGTVGPASDQFAFCVALYHALYGEHPFAAADRAQSRARVLAGEVTPPPRGSRVPAGVRSALLRGMAPSREDRWPSMRELILGLRRQVGRRSRLLPLAAVLAALLLTGLLAGLLTVARGAGDEPPAVAPDRASVAVLPFESPGAGSDDAFLSEGMTDALIANLARVEGLRVPARRSVYALRGRGLSDQQIAERLAVAHLLEGTVQRVGDRLLVSARLVDAGGGALWADRYERGFADLFDIEEEIATTIAARLQVELVGDRPIVARPTDDLEAYSLYLKGRSQWNRRTAEGLRTAVDLFQRAIARDPDFAEAYCGLADAYGWMPVYDPHPDPEALDKARRAARRALELEPDSAEAHASLGTVAMRTGDAALAQRHLRRAVELEPSYATAHHWLGFLLCHGLHRPGACVAELELARELDPASTPILAMLGDAYHLAGRHREALATRRQLLVLEPEWRFRTTCITSSFIALGRPDEAIAWMESPGAPSPRPLPCVQDLALAHHLRGEYASELTVARRALADHPDDQLLLEAEGGALAALGRVAEVEELFDRLLAAADEGAWSWLAVYNVIGELRVHGRAQTARALAARLVAWHRRRFPEDDRRLGLTRTLAMALIEAGRPAEGAEVLDAWFGSDRERQPSPPTGLSEHWLVGLQGWAAALEGRRAGARRALYALPQLEADSETPPFAAIILATLGETTPAMRALEERLAAGLVRDRELHVHPGLQPLRDDPTLAWPPRAATEGAGVAR